MSRRFAVQVVDADGNVMMLRHGGQPGEGAVVQFPSHAAAARQLKAIEHGLEEGDKGTVVLYRRDLEDA